MKTWLTCCDNCASLLNEMIVFYVDTARTYAEMLEEAFKGRTKALVWFKKWDKARVEAENQGVQEVTGLRRIQAFF